MSVTANTLVQEESVLSRFDGRLHCMPAWVHSLRPGEVWDCDVFVCPQCIHATRVRFAEVEKGGWWYCKYCYTNQRGSQATCLRDGAFIDHVAA